MKPLVAALAVLVGVTRLHAQSTLRNVPYADPPADRQVLDIYSPAGASKAPVVFWIHGGGWQAGDKSQIEHKPRIFMEKGFVFVSTNYRLLPDVDMGTLIRDVAKSLGWVHKHIAQHGGDPTRIFVMGHSAGAQLAAILCTDHRYLEAEGVPFSVLKGCVPVDGDTYDLPAIITTAEIRKQVHHLPPIKGGHREKFGNDPALHVDFSAVTHIAKGKGIPPFLILYVSSHPDTTAQAQRLAAVLQASDIPTKLFAGRDTNHSKLNDDLGLPDDAATVALCAFVDEQLKE
jgi:acetyl esterase/lipase